MMVIEVLIYERTSVSLWPGVKATFKGERGSWYISERTLEGAAFVGMSFSAARFFLRLVLLTGFSPC